MFHLPQKKHIVSWFFSIVIAFGFFMSPAIAAQKESDILGLWQTYDDKTGNPKAKVEITYNKKTKAYLGHIKKITPVAGYKPKTHCQKCPKPFTNQKIEGMMILWHLKPEYKGKQFKEFDNGYIIDPLSGKIYRFKIKLSKNKRILKTRAYKGIALVGRSQTWRRIEK